LDDSRAAGLGFAPWGERMSVSVLVIGVVGRSFDNLAIMLF
jgi:hypothetical protein